MSIASKLTLLQQDITDARTAITNKGGTVTTGGGSSQLATDIATIPTGGEPTGNIALTASTSDQTGINVASYATASIYAVNLNATASNMLSGTSATLTTNGSTLATVSGTISTYNWITV